MRNVRIPGTALAPSCLCFDTAEFGSTIDHTTAFALMAAYVVAGGNFIDTAKVYGDWVPGQVSPSEKIIGEWFQSRRNRGQIVLAIKGAHYHLDAPLIKRLKPADIVSDLDASLCHLRADVIDLYWLHRDDSAQPVAEIMETLEGQVKAGKIRHRGASNWCLGRLAEARTCALATGAQGFCAVSNQWSLASVDVAALPDPTMVAADDALWEYHCAHDLAAIPYTSQAYGVFHKLAAGRRDAIRVHVSQDVRQRPDPSLSRPHSVTEPRDRPHDHADHPRLARAMNAAAISARRVTINIRLRIALSSVVVRYTQGFWS